MSLKSIALRAAALAVLAVPLCGCVVLGAAGAVGGAAVAATGAVAGATGKVIGAAARGVGDVAGAVVPGAKSDSKTEN